MSGFDALLPCPFCGQKAKTVSDDSYGACMVFCACEAEPCVTREKGKLPEAIAAWNKRKPDLRAGLLRGAEIARDEADNCIDTDGPVACNKIATALEAEANKEVPRG